jgi:hypothetical protein
MPARAVIAQPVFVPDICGQCRQYRPRRNWSGYKPIFYNYQQTQPNYGGKPSYGSSSYGQTSWCVCLKRSKRHAAMASLMCYHGYVHVIEQLVDMPCFFPLVPHRACKQCQQMQKQCPVR